MKINVIWGKPLRLRDGSRHDLIYECSGLKRLPNKPGVYVFARRYGREVAPLYVGQALKLRNRIEQQLNNVRLMMGVKQARNGDRILLAGRIILQPGQRKGKVLKIVESALIKRALADGYDLLNQQGTKTEVHVIRSKGNTSSRQVAPLQMLAER